MPVSYTHLDVYKRQMLDIVVVNDGSTDNSVEIAQKYVNKYPDVYQIPVSYTHLGRVYVLCICIGQGS